MKNSTSSSSPSKRLIYYVLGGHFFFILILAFFSFGKKPEKKHLQIHTVIQTPPPQLMVVTPPKPVIAKAAVKKEVIKKAVAAPVKPKPAPAPLKKPVKKPAVSEELVKKLEESLAKIEEKTTTELKVPELLSPLKTEQIIVGEETSHYTNTLITCLQNALDLPEKGTVKIQLTLTAKGQFVKLEVLESESGRNCKFLEQELQSVRFPPFAGDLIKEKEHTFVITFCTH